MNLFIKKNKEKILVILFRSLGALFLILIYIQISRRLNSETSGYILLVLNGAMVAAVIIRLGLDFFIVRETSLNINPQTIFRNFFLIISILFLFLLLSAIIACHFFQNPICNYTLIAIYIPYPIALLFVITSIFQGLNKAVLSSILLSVSPLLIILTLIALTNTTDAKKILYIYILGYSLVLLFAYLLLKIEHHKKQKSKNKLSSQQIKYIIKSSPPFFFVNTASQLMIWLPQVIGSLTLLPKELSAFIILQRISISVSFFLAAIDFAVAAKFSDAFKKEDKQALLIEFLSSIKILFFLSMFSFIILNIFLKPILGLFGKDIIFALWPLRIMILAQLFNALTGPIGLILIMGNEENALKESQLITLFSSSILYLFLCIFYGLFGAAIAFSLTVLIQNILALVYIEKKLNINLFRDLVTLASKETK